MLKYGQDADLPLSGRRGCGAMFDFLRGQEHKYCSAEPIASDRRGRSARPAGLLLGAYRARDRSATAPWRRGRASDRSREPRVVPMIMPAACARGRAGRLVVRSARGRAVRATKKDGVDVAAIVGGSRTRPTARCRDNGVGQPGGTVEDLADAPVQGRAGASCRVSCRRPEHCRLGGRRKDVRQARRARSAAPGTRRRAAEPSWRATSAGAGRSRRGSPDGRRATRAKARLRARSVLPSLLEALVTMTVCPVPPRRGRRWSSSTCSVRKASRTDQASGRRGPGGPCAGWLGHAQHDRDGEEREQLARVADPRSKRSISSAAIEPSAKPVIAASRNTRAVGGAEAAVRRLGAACAMVSVGSRAAARPAARRVAGTSPAAGSRPIAAIAASICGG